MENFANFLQFVQIDRLPSALAFIAVVWISLRLATRSLDTLAERWTERRLLVKQVTAITKFAVLIIATVGVASTMIQFSDDAMLAIGGSVAVGIGLALNPLIASLAAGIILLFDRGFQVGDRVQFGDQYGEIVEIGLRAVRMVTLDDNFVSIPNSRFLNDVVASANSGALQQMCVFDFWIGCNEDMARAKQVIYEATASSRYVFLELPISIVVREEPVKDMNYLFAIRITAKAYVFDGRYEVAFGTDVTERVKAAFARAGIRTAGEMQWEQGLVREVS